MLFREKESKIKRTLSNMYAKHGLVFTMCSTYSNMEENFVTNLYGVLH